MKHRIIAIIIALLSGASITLLLIPALLSNRQLWLVFFISTSIIFFLIWVFNEFLVFRDLHKLKILIKRLAEDNELDIDAEHNLKMLQSQDLAHDITDYYNRKNQHLEELIKNSDLRRQFIADVSHELKSPLFSAQGYVHTLLDGAVLDKEVRTKFLMKAA